MESLDWSVDPCHNFYNFVCNRWMSEQVINNRQVTQFNVLEQKNSEIIVAKLRDENATNEYKHVSKKFSWRRDDFVVFQLKTFFQIKAISKAQRDFSTCLGYSRESDETKLKTLRSLSTNLEDGTSALRTGRGRPGAYCRISWRFIASSRFFRFSYLRSV